MTTIMPEGEDLRRAVKWISEMRQAQPSASMAKLIDQASARFNLSPLDADFLARCLKNESGQGCEKLLATGDK